MRRGFHAQFIEFDGKVIGINLGRDSVAEHEIGIQKLRSAFHMDKNKIGAEYFQANTPFPPLDIHEQGDEMIVICDPYALRIRYHESPSFEQIKVQNELHTWGEYDLSGAWDDDSFGVFVKGEENKQKLKEALLDPYQDGDLMIFITGILAECSGLTLLRASALPEAEKAKMKANHEDRIAMLKAAEETGIKEKLHKAKKEWLALSPRWAKEFEQKKTEYPVVFWLNPMHQQIDNYGWYTVEELLLWTEGKGPIPIKKR